VAKNDFVIGVMHSAWWLHQSHGADSYAEELLMETFGAQGYRRIRRLAREESFDFSRHFWKCFKQRVDRRLAEIKELT